MVRRLLTFKRFIFYGFPIYLVIAEYSIRFLLSYAPGKTEDLAVVGSTSTVTAAGLSLIAPVLIPKPVTLNQSASRIVAASGVVMMRAGDQRLIACAYLALLILPFAWGGALWMVHRDNSDYDIALAGLHVPGPFLIGVCIYLIGMAFTEVKEAV